MKTSSKQISLVGNKGQPGRKKSLYAKLNQLTNEYGKC